MKVILPYFGELLGTFILVFIGCSTVALSVLGMAFPTLLQIATVWGFGVALAIYASRQLCPAHLNPAVSLALFLDKQITIKKLSGFIGAQFIGALLAGIGVYLLFNPSLVDYEAQQNITRGSSDSWQSAKMFGEFFNPAEVSHSAAMIAEAIGTFVLMFVIFIIGNTRRKIDKIAPLLIGGTVSVLIIYIAPYTQGGFNPARDFSPRLVAYFGGWNDAAFPVISGSFLTVYILGPFLGASLAYLAHKIIWRSRKL